MAAFRSTPTPGDRDDVSKVKDACDIVRIIGEQVQIKPKGREYVCLCPFHDDHNPSMRVIPAKQIFHCFVCGTGGDVLKFTQLFHKMEFREALEHLAEKAGITLTPWKRPQGGDSAQHESGVAKKDVRSAAEQACGFFQGVLRHAEHGAAARAVIERRGITPAMVEQFQLGAAPDRFDGLVLYAQHHGLNREALLEAGLFKTRESGGVYDLLRHRLIFPIHDRLGKVIAFGGRKLRDEDEPKYINSPETRLFEKSKTLYALHHASREIQAQRTVLVTEGYMDAMACHQGGFRNAVATLGTALTRDHAAMLRHLCDNVVLLFDGDDAGQRAADRAVPVFFAESIDVRVATLSAYTDAKDPDELLKREGGADVFRRVLAGSVDLLEYRFARVRRTLAGAGDARLSKAILGEIESMVEMGLRDVEPVRQKLIVKRLSQLARLDESTILRAIPAGRRPRVVAASAESSGGPDEPPSRNVAKANLSTREHMLGCVLNHGPLWTEMSRFEKDAVSPASLEFDELKPLAQAMLDVAEDGGLPSLEEVMGSTSDERIQSLATALYLRIEGLSGGDRDRLAEDWAACRTRLRLDAAMSMEPKASPTQGSTGDADAGLKSIAERIAQRQAMLQQAGADRRVLPRKS